MLNFSLVITLALAPPPQWPGVLIREASPLLAIFYLAAIAERALSYWGCLRLILFRPSGATMRLLSHPLHWAHRSLVWMGRTVLGRVRSAELFVDVGAAQS